MTSFLQHAKLRTLLFAGLTLGIGWAVLSSSINSSLLNTHAARPAASLPSPEPNQSRFNLRWREGVDGDETARHQQALQNSSASPLSLSPADLDEDGMPDLVSGY